LVKKIAQNEALCFFGKIIRNLCCGESGAKIGLFAQFSETLPKINSRQNSSNLVTLTDVKTEALIGINRHRRHKIRQPFEKRLDAFSNKKGI
jgi:hypothetical protein